MEPTPIEIAWAAGFMEGEGSFHRWKTNKGGYDYARIKVSQVNREPLERLKSLFGGSICLERKASEGKQEIWYWSLLGRKAEELLRLVLPHMSSRRAVQIERALKNEINRIPYTTSSESVWASAKAP